MTIISDATDFSMYNRLQVSNILDGTSDTAGSCRTSRSGVSLRIGGPGELVWALSVHDLGSTTIEGYWHLLSGVHGSGANDDSKIDRV